VIPALRTYRGKVGDGEVTLFLCGDVMTGRGVDQILRRPVDPRLWEGYVRDARTYVALAEAINGPVPAPVGYDWPWGDALAALDEAAPDARIINLETSITHSHDVAPGKAVHYRMAPENIECLTAAKPDVCTLANNHVLDFGHRGLDDTLWTLRQADLASTGAGADADAARRPALLTLQRGARVIVGSAGTSSSGIPTNWAAADDRSGVQLLPDLSPTTARALAGTLLRRHRSPGDIVVASIHWGSNWGYEVPSEHVAFAHHLVDLGIDVVHGHSSHHPRPIEVYRGKLILYGCGDFIDDYEGIRGYERYRDDLRLLYLATVEAATGRLTRLRMVPMQARQLRLHHASREDAEFLRTTLTRFGERFGSRVDIARDRSLHLHLPGA
jgi:poly-gamma-glutamate capsule biosynthesis protein CapA/YwtB (metallophosphatase superfamily)